MVGKNNFKQHMASKGNKAQRFTVRKLSVGVASVSVGAMLLIPNGALQVSAEEASVEAVEETAGLVETENPNEAEVVVEEEVAEEQDAAPVEEEQTEEVVVEEAIETVEENSREAEVVEEPVAAEEPVAPVQEEVSEIEQQNIMAPAQAVLQDGSVNFVVRSPNNMEYYENALEDFSNYPLILTSQETGETYELRVVPNEANISNNFRVEADVEVSDGGTWFDITLPSELIDLGYSLSRDHQVRAYSSIVGSTNLSYNAPQDTSDMGEVARRDLDYDYLDRRDIEMTLTSQDGSRIYTLGSRDLELPSGEYTIRISNAPTDSRPELLFRESSTSSAAERVIALEQDGADYVGTVNLDFSDSTRPQILQLSPALLVTIEAPEVYDLATRKSPNVEGVTPEGAEEIRVYLPGDSEEYREANILSENPFTGERGFRLVLPEGYTFEAGQEVRVTAVDENGNESEAAVRTIIDSDAVSQLTVDPIYPEASTISGTVNPEVESVQVYLPSGAMVSGSIQDDGTWSANLFSNASQLTPGETISVGVRINGNTHRYDDAFTVQEAVEAAISLENSQHILARLGYYNARYYRNTITLVDELGRPVEGLTEADFNLDTFGGIVNFSADGNVYTIDTAEAGELRPDHSLSIDEDGVIQINIADEREADISLENSQHILARLGYYNARYYRNTITLVDELGRPVEGLTEADFNLDTFGGIVNFSADGNVYTIDTAEAGELRPDHSLSIDEDGVIQINIADEREADISLENSQHILARLGYYNARYYRNTITLVDELGRPVEGLTEEDFEIIGFGGIANFSAEGNVYRIDTAEADELRPDYSLSIEDGVITITIVDNREEPEEPEDPEDPQEPEEPEEPEETIAELEERIAALEEAIRQLAEENVALADALAALQAQLTALQQELDDTNDASAALAERLAALEARIAELEAAVAEGEEQAPEEIPAEETDQNGEDTDESPADGDSGESSELDDNQSSEEDDQTEGDVINVDGEELPQAGVASSSSVLLAGALSILSGLGLMAGTKFKKDEE